ncbi:accessory Sec system protein Asp1 [Leuconostoc suionicum]|uniref:accessory Sec system protein Asp1 n=1 Tax=Leuconostoc suionicum TaxID=1511761 RepID=UPI0032DEC55A
MFYFVPYWGKINASTAFDDTVNQIRMFETVQEDTQTIILDYSPQMRCFLHQQSLSSDKYWSIFDEIQSVKNVRNKILDFTDFSWPKEAEFVYTPFRINIVIDQKLYASISFGIEGQLSEINYFDNEKIEKKLIFDDRGFVSSIIYFKNGEKDYQDYLDLTGIWQIRIKYLTNSESVIVNAQVNNGFEKESYVNLSELIQELLTKHFEQENGLKNSVLVIAANTKYNQLLLNLKQRPQKIVLSFFKDRYSYQNSQQRLLNEISVVDLAVVDTQEQMEDIKKLIVSSEMYVAENKLQHLSPYDTRFQLGNSQQHKELKIFLPIQPSSYNNLEYVLNTIINCMIKNKLIYLDIVCAEQQNIKKLEYHVVEALAKYFHLDYHVVLKCVQIDDESGENKIDQYIGNDDNIIDQQRTIIELYRRINVIQTQTEIDIIQAFESARLIIDINQIPNVYIQIAGISAGIPQINLTKSPYIINKKNGLIIQDLSELDEAIEYYLNGLRHWNESLVYSVKQISQYTNGAIVKQWKCVLGENDG